VELNCGLQIASLLHGLDLGWHQEGHWAKIAQLCQKVHFTSRHIQGLERGVHVNKRRPYDNSIIIFISDIIMWKLMHDNFTLHIMSNCCHVEMKISRC